MRGGHAHKELHQLIVSLSGSFDITIDDGIAKKTIHLNRAYKGLYTSYGMAYNDKFSSGSVCMVLASLPYDESDYIRDYADFKNAAMNQ